MPSHSDKPRYYEYRDGKSAKFWEVQVSGRRVIVRYGRIGTNGSTHIKRFSSPNAARNDAVYRVADKIGKGYELKAAKKKAVKKKAVKKKAVKKKAVKKKAVKKKAAKKKAAKKTTAKKKAVKKKAVKKKAVKKTAAKKTAASKAQRYYVHDNGGRPFLVEVRGSDVEVFERTGGTQERPSNYGKRVCGYTNVNVHVPRYSERHGKTTWKADGNTILIETKTLVDEVFYHYVWVGQEIYRFVTNEPISEFYSPVGNNDVPYPYAVSETKVYLVLEKVELSKAVFAKNLDWAKADPYAWYYDHVSRLETAYDYKLIRKRR